MRKKTTLGLCILSFCLLLSVVAPLAAQQTPNQGKPPMYTYVASWDVPRAQWAEMDKLADADKPVLDKLVADGILNGYGAYSNLLHQEGEPTHGTWFTSTSQANLLKALETIYKQPSLVGAPVQAASKHWDEMLVDRGNYGYKPGASTGYLIWSQWQIKPGEGQNYQNIVKSVWVPFLEKLLADGTITSYGFDMEDYHSKPVGIVYEYVTIPDATSLDKLNKAFDALFDSNPSLGAASRSATNREGHRDYMTRIRFMVNK